MCLGLFILSSRLEKLRFKRDVEVMPGSIARMSSSSTTARRIANGSLAFEVLY